MMNDALEIISQGLQTFLGRKGQNELLAELDQFRVLDRRFIRRSAESFEGEY